MMYIFRGPVLFTAFLLIWCCFYVDVQLIAPAATAPTITTASLIEGKYITLLLTFLFTFSLFTHDVIRHSIIPSTKQILIRAISSTSLDDILYKIFNPLDGYVISSISIWVIPGVLYALPLTPDQRAELFRSIWHSNPCKQQDEQQLSCDGHQTILNNNDSHPSHNDNLPGYDGNSNEHNNNIKDQEKEYERRSNECYDNAISLFIEKGRWIHLLLPNGIIRWLDNEESDTDRATILRDDDNGNHILTTTTTKTSDCDNKNATADDDVSVVTRDHDDIISTPTSSSSSSSSSTSSHANTATAASDIATTAANPNLTITNSNRHNVVNRHVYSIRPSHRVHSNDSDDDADDDHPTTKKPYNPIDDSTSECSQQQFIKKTRHTNHTQEIVRKHRSNELILPSPHRINPSMLLEPHELMKQYMIDMIQGWIRTNMAPSPQKIHQIKNITKVTTIISMLALTIQLRYSRTARRNMYSFIQGMITCTTTATLLASTVTLLLTTMSSSSLLTITETTTRRAATVPTKHTMNPQSRKPHGNSRSSFSSIIQKVYVIFDYESHTTDGSCSSNSSSKKFNNGTMTILSWLKGIVAVMVLSYFRKMIMERTVHQKRRMMMESKHDS